MNEERILHLLRRYQQNIATSQEIAEFAAYLADADYKPIFDNLLDERWNTIDAEEIAQTEMTNYHQILATIKAHPKPLLLRKNWWPRIATVAAILFMLLSISLYFSNHTKVSLENQNFANDFKPGKTGATLTLANGKKILIKDVLAGDIANEAGVKIIKTKDGEISYEITETNNGAVKYNTLTTSRGEQTHVRLPDGTVVFLNAESSLKYPTSFAKTQKRQVSLTGEGYFQVAKDKHHPFLVQANNQTVEVLGTTFNISSYTDESMVKTTLLEGSVRISNINSNLTSILKPGEQATVNHSDLEIKNVEVNDVVAWKNGYFMFNNETLESIMKKVARWYNVDVSFQNELLKRKTFFGSTSRFDNVSELLKLLQQTGGVSFEINDNKIIVSQ